jgi:hypothetical protein
LVSCAADITAAHHGDGSAVLECQPWGARTPNVLLLPRSAQIIREICRSWARSGVNNTRHQKGGAQYQTRQSSALPNNREQNDDSLDYVGSGATPGFGRDAFAARSGCWQERCHTAQRRETLDFAWLKHGWVRADPVLPRVQRETFVQSPRNAMKELRVVLAGCLPTTPRGSSV